MLKTLLVTSFISSVSFIQIEYVYLPNLFQRNDALPVIADKITGELYLKSFCLNKMMDDSQVTKNIQDTLIGFQLLSPAEAQYVRPEHLLLTGRNQYRLRVLEGVKVAYSRKITFIVENHSDITTWHYFMNDFHFIAYFTSQDYFWLKNLLTNDPKFSSDAWFLGAFIQILNDNDFNSDFHDIPWTTSLKKIFSWDDRLARHMLHFGDIYQTKSQTADGMINMCNSSCWNNYPCRNIKVLFHNLKHALASYSEKKGGLMMNLRWSFHNPSSSDHAYFQLEHSLFW